MTFPLTGWYPASIKPVREGLYLVSFEVSRQQDGMLQWDGGQWWYREIRIAHRAFWWAGLAFDPSRAVECQDAETGCSGMWVPTR